MAREIAAQLLRTKHKLRIATNFTVDVDPILLSSPPLPGLCEGDILEGLRLAEIKAVSSDRLRHPPHELSTSYAAIGKGLCKNPQNKNRCQDEEYWQMPAKHAMAVIYNRDALFIHFGIMRQALRYLESKSDSIVDWEAGSDALSSAPHARSHWDHIQVRLLERPNLNYPPSHVDYVVLSGESVKDERFLNVVKDAFVRYRQDPAPEFIMFDDPTSTGARGAVELAYRARFH